MKPKILLILLSGVCLSVCPLYAQMTDEAILTYITEGLSKGKSQSQIGNELLAKGVTASQAKRLMKSYQSGNAMDTMMSSENVGKIDTKRSTVQTMRQKMVSGENPNKMVDSLAVKEDTGEHETNDPRKKKEGEKTADAKIIFGHDIFQKKNLSFEPNQNAATPSDYVLGPGDEIVLDIFGMNEATVRQTISPEGRISIANVGPVQLSGLTIEQATKKLKSALAVKYDLMGPGAQSDLVLTLGSIRTIQVNVIGEVKIPGTYRLSSLSTVLNALYHAGGVTAIGSLRRIKLVRAGKVISHVDLYKVLFDGYTEKQWSLKEGDAIIVPPYEALVNVSGGVKRPMLYEAVKGEAIGDVIKFAGGFASLAYADYISVQRQTGSSAEVFTVKSADYGTFGVEDGDVIKPYTNNAKDIFVNKVTLEGFVLRPGVYQLGGDIATVKQLIEHAGGLLDGAFENRAQLVREKPDRTLELEGVAIGAIVKGIAPDIMLRNHDVLIVSSVEEMEKKGDVQITGYVTSPGFFKYAEGMTIEDLILLAGGLEEGASAVCVEVGRRVLIEDSKEPLDTIAQVFTCNFEHDLLTSNDSKFKLEPNDIVSVRKNPTYIPQRKVLVTGEVTFPGTYTLVVNNQRLSDIFYRAGGATNYANIKAATLKRKVSEYERNVRRNMSNLVKMGAKLDSVAIERLKISEVYTVGISLDKALANPGCADDIILQDGDELIVPNFTNTVRVQGEVNYPNAVNYIPGETLKYYVNQSGGWTQNARRGKSYVVYMNGKVSVGRSSKIMPGSEVVVPARPEKKKMSAGEWVGIGTATASMAASIASVITLIISSKK